jgi:hypothetical protein
MARGPRRVTWSEHALVKARFLGLTRTDVERAVIERHGERLRNPGDADWKLVVGRLVVAYNHPDRDGDESTAAIVTLWRRR